MERIQMKNYGWVILCVGHAGKPFSTRNGFLLEKRFCMHTAETAYDQDQQ